MIKKVRQLTYYQFLIGLRIKQAFFFSIVFPLFVFILFNMIWNSENDSEITLFFLTGIVCANTVSEGVYSISNIIKEYVKSGYINYLKKMFDKEASLLHFLSVILARITTFLIILIILLILGKIMFGLNINLNMLWRICLSVPVGLFIFSFLGLVFAFTGIRNMETSANHFIFYIIVFSSDAYFMASRGNTLIRIIGNALPLNPLLELARGENINIPALFIWSFIPLILFLILFKYVRLNKR